MIRTLQCIDWSVVPPAPIALHRRVSVFSGQNGSGKSSAMDALKAVLGVARMGQGRTPSSYIHSGRDIAAPASQAWVLACCHLDDPPAFADSSGDFTLLLNATRTRRLFMALPGHLLLGVSGDLASDLSQLQEDYPRKVWMNPEDYSRRILSVIGVSRATQRIMEIPQGEAQRLLDARPDRLLRDLLGLMGALDPLEVLEERRGLYQEAAQERDRAKRALLEEELSAARAEQQLGDGGRIIEAEKALAELAALARGAKTARVAELMDEAADLKLQAPKLRMLSDRLAEELSKAESQSSAPGLAASALLGQLSEAGIECHLADQHCQSEPLRAYAADKRFAVIVCASDWLQAALIAANHPQAFLAMAESAQAWWAEQSAPEGEMQGAHWLLGGKLLAPKPGLLLPEAQLAELRQSAWSKARDLQAVQSRQLEISELMTGLEAIELEEGETIEAGPEELAGLLGEMERAKMALDSLRKEEARRSDNIQALQEQRARLAEARVYLEGQEGALENARDALAEARQVYQQRVHRLVEELGRHFSELCQSAGMRGELELTEDALAEAGGRLGVHVAETTDGPLRAYAEADLSGGWRAKTSLLVLLAALAASAEGTMRLILSDEPFAALDEDRISEVGWTFQRLARSAGLQFVITLPTRRASEAVEWADLSVAFLKAGPHDQYAPLPHLLEASEEATMPPA